jgi:small subunit ribosomal protein S1
MSQIPNDVNNTTEFDTLLAESTRQNKIKEGTIVIGTITDIEDDAVIIDIGAKTEGRVHKREFAFQKDKKELAIGDKTEIYLERIENHNGECILSRSKAKSKEIWSEIEKSFNSGELVEGIITGKVKGGLSVEIGITAFLPGSQIDTRPLRDVSHLMDTPMKFRILKMDVKRNNIVVSRRAVLEEMHKETRAERFSQLKLGDVVEGKVKALTDYGAFIDLGSYDSLLHSSDITYKRIGHPSEVLKIDQQVKVKIIKVDPEKNRVSVGMKQLEDDPWNNVKDKFNVNDKVKGVVTNVADYGIFIEIVNGVEGLCHSSELSWSAKQNSKPGNLYARSQSVDCQILEIDHEKRRLSLGIKQLMPNPWQKFNDENPIGKILDTSITSIKDNILFCNLDEEIDGAVFSKDLSWEADPKEEIKKYKVGDQIKVKIISNDNEKVALSVREVDGNPFDEIREKAKGDIVTCSVIETGDFGVKVKIGDKGPSTIIKKSDLALRKSDARPDRWARNDKLDASIVNIDIANYKINLSIRVMEEQTEKEAMLKYGSKDSGASLGAILGKALGRDKKED